jgi:general secretion pathway protein C
LNHNPRMSSRWTGFFIWALVAASVAFWGIKIFAATRPVPPGAQAPQAVAANGPMERLFGAVVVTAVAAPAAHPESERFQLVGVIAPPSGAAGEGFAVVVLDGQPARTWRVGALVDGNTSLLAVSKRGAEFGPQGGPTAFTLQLPEPAAAETGTLQTAVSQPDPAQLQQQQQPQLQQMQQQQQRENGAHVGQAPLPTRGGFQNAASLRGGQPPMGRGGFQGPPGGVAPARNATPPGPQNDGTLQQ